jgi:hypothetical protein
MSNFEDQKTDKIIVDTRFQSFYKCFIIDILNSDQSKSNNYKVIKIKNLYVSKVCITGFIIAIYEQEKFFRCKIDDSTGKINVTIWKDQIFKLLDDTEKVSSEKTSSNETNLNDTIFGDESNSVDEELNPKQKNEIQTLFNSIRIRTNDPTINNSIANRPVQGDLLTVKGYVKSYRNIFEINSVSCTRIKNSNEEYVEMLMPIVLHEKCYQLNHKDINDKNKVNSMKNCEINKENSFVIDEIFLNLVYNRLISNVSSNSRKPGNSFQLFINIRDNYSEFKAITHKDVIDALKKLEIKCMIYSCDNDNTYLPIS